MILTKLQKGDVYCIEGHEYVVFYVSTDIIGFIRKDKVEFMKFDTNDFIKKVNDGVCFQIATIQVANAPSVPDDELKRIGQLSLIMDKLIENQYPEWNQIIEHTQNKYVFAAAQEADYKTAKSFRKVFYRYLRSGCNMSALIDNRHLKMARSVLSEEITIPENNVLTDYEAAMRFGLDVFKRKLSVTAAYDDMIIKYFSEIKNVVKNGVLEQVAEKKKDAPSYHTLNRYIANNLGEVSIKQYKKGEREVRNNERLLTGNQRSGIITIGQVMQLDECKVSVHLTDSYGRVIGKPVVYCAFDPAAQIILGFHVGFTDNSYDGVVNLFLSMMEPHENQTSLVGVHCDDYSFPSLVLPRQVYCDQGSEYMSKAMEKAMLELGITISNVPAAAGSYKGGVENCFHRLQSRLYKLLINDGYVRQIYNGTKEAMENAVLTIDDFKAICYRIVKELNTTSLGEMFSPDADMIDNHIPPVPAEIWKHKIKTCFDPIVITDYNRMQKMFCLLWRNKVFTRDRDGLTYKGHNLRYFADEEWFHEMLVKTNANLDIRYSSTDLSQIYVRYQDIIHTVPLATARDELRSYIGMTWTAYDEAYKEYVKMKKDQQEKDQNTHLTTVYNNAMTIAVAKAAHEGIENDIKSLPEARAIVQNLVETSQDETRNRLLGVKPIAVESNTEADNAVSIESKTDAKEKYAALSSSDLASLIQDEEE